MHVYNYINSGYNPSRTCSIVELCILPITLVNYSGRINTLLIVAYRGVCLPSTPSSIALAGDSSPLSTTSEVSMGEELEVCRFESCDASCDALLAGLREFDELTFSSET